MKKLTLILTLIPFLLFSQSDVPDEFWINDSNFEETIGGNSAFGDDNQETILIEFWAKFNEENCFADWKKIENAKYYRVNIAEAPEAKKKYRVRMAPTLVIFKSGVKEEMWKAGLDLLLPATLKEIQDAINEVNNASKF